MYRTLTQRRFMLVFVALTVMRVSGCAYQPGSFGDLTGGFNLIPQDMEIQIGAEAATEVEAEERVFNQPYIQDYINSLGQRLAQASRRPDIAYQFKVIDTDDINAFALPGGFIYVNRGLIEEAGSEAELAGVLAHEIGHVAARHGAKRMSKLITLQLGFALFWELSEKERDEELGLMIADAIATGFLLKNSRDDERQADDLGTETLYYAGYDPIALAYFFDKLAKEHSPSAIETFLSTHPSPGERIQNVQALIATFPPNPQAISDTSAFQDIRQSLTGTRPSIQQYAPQNRLRQQDDWQPAREEVGAPRRQ